MLGLFPTAASALAATFSNGSSIGVGGVAYGDSGGKIKSASGLAVIGTPSATAPDATANGQGALAGVAVAVADAANGAISLGTFGGGASKTAIFGGWAVQGTAASAGATITNDGVQIRLYGHDGSAYVDRKASIALEATGTWSGSSTPTRIRFATTPSTSATLANAGIVDQNQVLSWGGANLGNAVLAIGGSQTSAKMQCNANTSQGSAFAQIFWAASALGPTRILAKSRSATVNTQAVVTTGDTLGNDDYQGDDGTNMLTAARVKVTCSGTIASTRMPGNYVIQTGTDAAPSVLTDAITINNAQQVTHNATTDSTSISTGGAVFLGGVGVAKRLTIDGATGKTIRVTNTNANAAVAVTLGSTGCTGTTSGAPQGWMRIDIAGTDRFIPFW